MIINLDALLLRLNDNESYTVAFKSTTAQGWLPTIAWNPSAILKIDDDIAQPDAAIEDFVRTHQQQGRLIAGYLSYDLGCKLHDVKLTNDDDLHTPVALILAFDNWVSFVEDHAQIHAKNDDFKKELDIIMMRQPREKPHTLYRKGLSPAWSRGSYDKAYKRVHDYIEAGDIYQANLTHRLEGTTDATGLDIFQAVSSRSHADFQSYIKGTEFEIMSASPERFIRIRNNIIETMPIKGTRPRGDTPESDKKLRNDLLTSPKEMAELDMITDLMRNDLGVVARVGSVTVEDRRIITPYPTVWHAHSHIRALLRPEVSPISALLSLLPGGSITGCPKKRAMEIIDELETQRRGIYTGSIFMIDQNGNLDSNIAIRTMIKKSDDIYLSVGGGIVFDSTESDEYQESLQKAQSFLSVEISR